VDGYHRRPRALVHHDDERGRRLYFERAKKTNFTKDPEVKALIRELEDKISTTAQPRGPMGRGACSHGGAAVRRRDAQGQALSARARDRLDDQRVGGLPSGAVVRGRREARPRGERLLHPLGHQHGGGVGGAQKVHDSTTHFSRYVNMAAETTASKIQVAESYMELFRVNRLTLVN
jgi:hypothetical protein